jgi:uncharacterized repeat protein (TIGR03803 family)
MTCQVRMQMPRLLSGVITAIVIGSTQAADAHVRETVLHSFSGPDGAAALYGVIADAARNLYGTTVFGGNDGVGVVFELAPEQGGYSETVLYTFSGGDDGAKPSGGLVADAKGNLYGVTLLGGAGGCGTVFKLAPGKHAYTETVIYGFRCNGDGSQPIGTPVMDANGVIYGVTQFTSGFDDGNGVVFALTPSDSGYAQSVLYNFPGGAGGYLPQAGVTIDKNGAVYGTTYYGGDMSFCDGAGCGLVFTISPASAGYKESVLYAFRNIDGNDGANPFAAPVVEESTGKIFGTTQYGGSRHVGIVYELKPHHAGYDEALLHNFTANKDGFAAEGQILIGPKHTLYGTASLGGGGCSGIGCGAVYEMKRSPVAPGYSFRTIYDFTYPANGAEPEFTSLIMDGSGAIFGTTRSGGADTGCSDGGPGGAPGCGVVFRLAR